MRALILAAVLAWPIAAPAQTTFELQKLCADLDAASPDVAVLLNGIDPTATLKLLCHEVLQLKQQPFSTCFSFQLNITAPLSPETAQALARELTDVIPKIADACDAVKKGTLK